MISQDVDYIMKILIIGDSSVGKSNILLRFSDNIFHETFLPTIGVDFKMRNVDSKINQYMIRNSSSIFGIQLVKNDLRQLLRPIIRDLTESFWFMISPKRKPSTISPLGSTKSKNTLAPMQCGFWWAISATWKVKGIFNKTSVSGRRRTIGQFIGYEVYGNICKDPPQH